MGDIFNETLPIIDISGGIDPSNPILAENPNFLAQITQRYKDMTLFMQKTSVKKMTTQITEEISGTIYKVVIDHSDA